jgi:hypothetical protein
MLKRPVLNFKSLEFRRVKDSMPEANKSRFRFSFFLIEMLTRLPLLITLSIALPVSNICLATL